MIRDCFKIDIELISGFFLDIVLFIGNYKGLGSYVFYYFVVEYICWCLWKGLYLKNLNELELKKKYFVNKILYYDVVKIILYGFMVINLLRWFLMELSCIF